MGEKNNKPSGFRLQLFYLIFIIVGLLFIPTTIVLICGMAPTVAAAIVDISKRKYKTMTIGLLNFAGCSYSLLLLWTTGHTIDNALNILMNMQNMLIILFAAAGGYMVETAMTGLVSSVLIERAKLRLKTIEKRQQELKRRWGEEVTGSVPLDYNGYPIKSEDEPLITTVTK